MGEELFASVADIAGTLKSVARGGGGRKRAKSLC